jgi:carbonic anhydrase
VLLLATLCVVPAARAASWQEVSNTGQVIVELDTSSVVRDGDLSKAWEKATFKSDQGLGSGDVEYRTVQVLTRYDCVRFAAVPLAKVFFRADGSQLMRLNLEAVELPQPVVPDTPRARLLALACKAPEAPPVVAVAPLPQPQPAPVRRATRPKARPAPITDAAEPTPVAGATAAPSIKPQLVAKADASPAPAKPVTSKRVQWGYEGRTGPKEWARLSADWATCVEGRRQSPIDIKEGVRLQIDAIKFDYKPSPLHISNNGHTVQVKVAPGSSITVGGRTFELKQFHFHKPAEEKISGRGFDMAMHLMHQSKDGAIAMVAVLLMAGNDSPFIQTLWNNLPLDVDRDVERSDVKIDVSQMLPKARAYWTYIGSLTEPPCTEGVQWIVMKTPMQLSRTQIGIFGKLYEMNARPVQAQNGRLIKESS